MIDFHSHYYDPSWSLHLRRRDPPTGSVQRPGAPSGALARAWPLMTDIPAQLAAMEAAGIDTRVLSAPPATLVAGGAQLTRDLIERVNDRLAALVGDYPGRLLALATIDAFQGDAAAREIERAVHSLGFGGICVDCAQGDRYLDVPEARPALETAAVLGGNTLRLLRQSARPG